MLQEIKCKELWGVDISTQRLERAAKKVPHAILRQEDLNHTTLESNFFDNIIARVIFRKPPIINPDHYHFITGFFLKREFKIKPCKTKHIPEVPAWLSIHRVVRYEMAHYRGRKPYTS